MIPNPLERKEPEPRAPDEIPTVTIRVRCDQAVQIEIINESEGDIIIVAPDDADRGRS
jgi:hypothetical protein